ncbi:MAG: DUF4159 domain-containing protein [Gemmatimonadota bacterium]|nr:DUF4159 domain-containing protein [Gemmatimonadota bacterium]
MKRPWKIPLQKNRKLQNCLALSLALHLLVIFGITHRERVSQFPILPPIMLKFTKRPPPQRTLARRQRPMQRPLVRRPALQAAPVAAVRPSPSASRPLPVFKSSALRLPTASLPDRLVLPVPDFPARHIGPQMRAGALAGTRQGADEIDLSLELMDVQALDTGRHRAMVVVDPKDRRQLKGFLYLSSVHSEALERAEASAGSERSGGWSRSISEQRILQGLADKMSERTGVRTQVLDGIALDDPFLMQVPFLLLTVRSEVSFTQAEAKNLGRYLTSGGFLYADIVSPPISLAGGYQHDLPALRDFIRQAFQQIDYAEHRDWSFVRLPPEHPLYHCFYDVDTLPRGFWDIMFWYWNTESRFELSPNFLEGIEVDGRIVGVYSQKNYADLLAGEAERIRESDRDTNLIGRFDTGADELPVYNLGVNIVVYALTREGALARRLIAAD